MRQIIRLRQSELNHIICECVKKCINESFRGEMGLKSLGQNSEPYVSLQNAKTMLQNNEPPLKIKQTTGWEIGYDGKWKYEGVDGFIKQTPIGEINVLGDIWDDEDLYKWYPQMRNIRIIWKTDFNNGDFASSGPTYIEIPRSLAWWDGENKQDFSSQFLKQTAEKTLQHEIQHIIQSFENWDNGVPAPDYTKHQEIISDLRKQLQLAQKYRNLTQGECRELYKKTEKNSIERRFFVELLSYLQQGYTTDDYIGDLKQQISNYPSFDKLEQDYYNANGEKEAFEVNNRYGWNYDKRRNTLMTI